MSRAGVSYKEIKKKMLKDEGFKKEYEKLEPRYTMIEEIIRARNEQKMSQSELARRVGTQKSNISRLESGTYNPSLDMLIRISNALGKKLSIQLN